MAETMDGAIREETENNKPNPFMQPPILEVLFRLVSPEDLAKCRLINRLWYQESLPTWRSNATFKLEYKDGGIVPQPPQDDGTTKRTYSIKEILDLVYAWERAWNTTIKKFSLYSWWFPTGVSNHQFMELIGANLTSLLLHNCVFLDKEHFTKMIFEGLPNLRNLKMEQCRAYQYYCNDPPEKIYLYQEPDFGLHGLKSLELSGCLPLPIMDLFTHFHKLESLKMRTAGKTRYGHLLNTIRVIRAQDQRKLPLTNFDVDFDFEFGDITGYFIGLLELHDELNLPLQHLEIWLKGDMECRFNIFNNCRKFNNEDVIRDILQRHSSTLKHLEVSGMDGPGLCKSFPFGIYLENLEELVIRTPSISDNFSYLMNTPNLRALDFVDFSHSDSESDELFLNSPQLEIEDWTLPSLRDLTFDCPLSLCNLGILMRWMPNVERLCLELDDAKFSMVCENWRNLKYLEDWGEELTDEGVIGMGNVHEAGDDEEAQIGPNIINLKSLNSFKTSSSKLTSATVHGGFLKLANLKDLSLGGLTVVDHETRAALRRQKIGLHICSLQSKSHSELT